MELIFTPQAAADLDYWKQAANKAIQKKIEQLIMAIQENPFEGLGKPEPLKHQLSGSWCRGINRGNCIIYEIYDDGKVVVLEIQSLKGHYVK